MKGIIKSIHYDEKGNPQYYFIAGDDGEEYFLHHSDMIKKSKHYKRGRAVTFDVKDCGKKHLKAINCDVDYELLVPTRCGRGRWIQIGEKGRIRCTDCGCTTDQMTTGYCPHCGASMDIWVPDNQAEIQRKRERLVALHRWVPKPTVGKYRCTHCGHVASFKSSFCGICGKYMGRKENEDSV